MPIVSTPTVTALTCPPVRSRWPSTRPSNVRRSYSCSNPVRAFLPYPPGRHAARQDSGPLISENHPCRLGGCRYWAQAASSRRFGGVTRTAASPIRVDHSVDRFLVASASGINPMTELRCDDVGVGERRWLGEQLHGRVVGNPRLARLEMELPTCLVGKRVDHRELVGPRRIASHALVSGSSSTAASPALRRASTSASRPGLASIRTRGPTSTSALRDAASPPVRSCRWCPCVPSPSVTSGQEREYGNALQVAARSDQRSAITGSIARFTRLGSRSLRHDHHADERSQEQARELPRAGAAAISRTGGYSCCVARWYAGSHAW